VTRGVRKAIRDLVQVAIAVVGAGGATALLDALVDSVDPAVGVVLAFVFKVLIAYAQNTLESRGRIPVLLPSPGLVTTGTGTLQRAVGAVVPQVEAAVQTTVEGVATTEQRIAGPVLDNAGRVVGAVTGVATDLLGGVPRRRV
jgi:hypothetical protein